MYVVIISMYVAGHGKKKGRGRYKLICYRSKLNSG